ncbi:MAG TPA: cysteine dioxygenase family protein [Pyrinomonadaceae bacterium]|nr:cysteine dioxygenase family protein [Pyrinomonadaceae bacterium]
MNSENAVAEKYEMSGFKFLIEKFSECHQTPSLPDICGWLGEANFTNEEFEPYRRFSEEKYMRNLVFRNDFVEILVLGWIPEQESLIHDHDGSHGVVRVFEGSIVETKFHWDEDMKIRKGEQLEATKGMMTSVGEPDIHHLKNTSAQNSLTVHVYAPPLKRLHIFKEGSSEVEIIELY